MTLMRRAGRTEDSSRVEMVQRALATWRDVLSGFCQRVFRVFVGGLDACYTGHVITTATLPLSLSSLSLLSSLSRSERRECHRGFLF